VTSLGVLAETVKCEIKVIAAVSLEDVAWLLCQSQGGLDEGGGWLMTHDDVSACKARRTCTHMHTHARTRRRARVHEPVPVGAPATDVLLGEGDAGP
jgi:hypothetical protein